MTSILFLLVYSCLSLLLRFHLISEKKESQQLSKLKIRNDDSLYDSCSSSYLYNNSITIIGKVAESVEEDDVKKHYSHLLSQRDNLFKNTITKKNNTKLWKRYVVYSNRVKEILEHQNKTRIASHFNSLYHISSGNVCDGCWNKQNIKIRDRNPSNGLLLRKFEGNKETTQIYTPEKRIFFIFM